LIPQKRRPTLFSKPFTHWTTHNQHHRDPQRDYDDSQIEFAHSPFARLYASSPVSEIRLAAPASPLAFKMHFYAA
jgi:fatty acid desaturase